MKYLFIALFLLSCDAPKNDTIMQARLSRKQLLIVAEFNYEMGRLAALKDRNWPMDSSAITCRMNDLILEWSK